MKHETRNRENSRNVPCSMFRVPCRKGFTLIEMLIVVAIIGILASIVLLGIGPTRSRARDARRISDLRQVQTALELYFGKNGAYPPGSTWAGLSGSLVSAAIGITQIPNDPNPSANYQYASDGTTYVLGATLEDSGNPVLRDSIHTDPIPGGFDCSPAAMYCLQF